MTFQLITWFENYGDRGFTAAPISSFSARLTPLSMINKTFGVPERQPAPASGCSGGARRPPCVGGAVCGQSRNQTWLTLLLCVSCRAQAQSQCGLRDSEQRNDLSKRRVHGTQHRNGLGKAVSVHGAMR